MLGSQRAVLGRAQLEALPCTTGAFRAKLMVPRDREGHLRRDPMLSWPLASARTQEWPSVAHHCRGGDQVGRHRHSGL